MILKVGFAKPTAWFIPISWAIRLVEWLPFSHTYFSFLNDQAVDSVLESNVSAGTVETPLQGLLDRYVRVEEYGFEMTTEQTEAFYAFCKKWRDTPYSLIELVGILTSDIFELTTNPFARADRMVCTKLLFLFMREQPGVFFTKPPELSQSPDTVGLREIYELILSSPLKKRTI